MSAASGERQRPRSLWARHSQVIFAVMLRDVRTRMGSAPAFIIVILWPLTHILLLVALFSFAHRLQPFGESMGLWAATGVVSYMTFSYTSRFSMMGIALNKPLLGFPVVTPLHILFGRIFVQILVIATVIIIVYALFYFLGIDTTPADPVGVAEGFLVLFGIGVGFGIFWGVLAGIWPIIVTGYVLVLILLWATAGVIFVPSSLPAGVIKYLKFHPVLQGIEWVRNAYFVDYDSIVLNKPYVLGWVAGSIFLGLLAERIGRGKILRN